MPKKNLSGQYYIKDGPENRFWSLFIVLFRPDSKRGRAELSNGVSVAIWRQKLTSPGLVTFDKVKIGAQLGTIGVKLLIELNFGVQWIGTTLYQIQQICNTDYDGAIYAIS